MGHVNVSFSNISWGRLYCIVFSFWVGASLTVKRNKKYNLINYGWIGTTYVKNWDEAEAFDLLTNLGAFEYKLEQGE